jgi:hypothetical protein
METERITQQVCLGSDGGAIVYALGCGPTKIRPACSDLNIAGWKREAGLYPWLRECFRSDRRARSMPGLTSSTNPMMAPAVARKAVRTVCAAATMPPMAHAINISVRPTHRIQGAVLRTSRERPIRLKAPVYNRRLDRKSKRMTQANSEKKSTSPHGPGVHVLNLHPR